MQTQYQYVIISALTEHVEELRKHRQENDILQRQIELLRSQCVLAENGRKRAEDRIEILKGNSLIFKNNLCQREKRM
ncbi:hypothetical protein HOLleu_29402 [Holothuria leucospilota]|uniref:Uncharacterized protein n=1 Tax=Holothuria leucospilota TaxID=206669 RepID=A0A9Q1BNR2_HOLLE|nr:hypothetical protein HOLleu_29402 [Holothuria leucospilota]